MNTLSRRDFAKQSLSSVSPLVLSSLEPPQLTLTLGQPRGSFRKGTQSVELPKMAGRYDGDLLSLAAAIRGEREYEYSLEHCLA